MRSSVQLIVYSLSSLFLLACTNPKNEKPANVGPSLDINTDFLSDKDIDGDGIPDEILFDYTEGAHCCYLLTLTLSSDGMSRKYPFEMDGGYEFGQPDASQPQHFNIVDYDNDGRDEIYLEIETYNGRPNPLPETWKDEYGISSHNIVFEFRDSLTIINVPPYISIEQFFHQQKQVYDFAKMIPFKKGNDHAGYKFGFKNERGELVILPILDSMTAFTSEVAIVTLNREQLLIDKRGAIVSTFEDWYLLDNQTKEDWPILIANKTITEFYYMDQNGKVLNEIPYTDAKSFTEGIAAVEIDDERWGYIDVNNNWLYTPQFKHAHPFENGKAMVEVKDTFLWVDKDGNFVR